LYISDTTWQLIAVYITVLNKITLRVVRQNPWYNVLFFQFLSGW
jgi:hypothetical protein